MVLSTIYKSYKTNEGLNINVGTLCLKGPKCNDSWVGFVSFQFSGESMILKFKRGIYTITIISKRWLDKNFNACNFMYPKFRQFSWRVKFTDWVRMKNGAKIWKFFITSIQFCNYPVIFLQTKLVPNSYPRNSSVLTWNELFHLCLPKFYQIFALSHYSFWYILQ